MSTNRWDFSGSICNQPCQCPVLYKEGFPCLLSWYVDHWKIQIETGNVSYFQSRLSKLFQWWMLRLTLSNNSGLAFCKVSYSSSNLCQHVRMLRSGHPKKRFNSTFFPQLYLQLIIKYTSSKHLVLNIVNPVLSMAIQKTWNDNTISAQICNCTSNHSHCLRIYCRIGHWRQELNSTLSCDEFLVGLCLIEKELSGSRKWI